MSDRFRLLPALALVAVLVAAGCSGGPKGASGAGEQAAAGSVAVTLSEFSITPSQIRVPAGQALTFQVKNAGTAQHSFAIDAAGKTIATDLIDPGASATLRVPGLDAGAYQAYCTVPGHKDLGMVATVVAGQASSSGSVETSGSGSMMGGGSMMAGSMSADQMAQMHRQGVEAFPAETKGTGNQPLEPTIQGGVKIFLLVAQEVQWEVSPGVFKDAMAYNGQIPGPEIRVHQGDRIRVVLTNHTSQPTTIHFHGMTVPNKDDGVPYITQDPIMPGASFVYELTVKDPPGMYVYHSHFNSTEQVGKGLYGAFIVEPKGGNWSYPAAKIAPATGRLSYGPPPKVNVESTLFLGDGPLGYVLNGKGFPATQPIIAKRGDWVLIHLANDGSMLHPMHLHGYHFEVVGEDGFPLRMPYMVDTLVITPGQRYDVLVHAVYPGVWAFHCHILPHVEGPEGMYGMVTALVVH